MLRITVAAILLALAFVSAPVSYAVDDPVIDVPNDDAEMNAAMAKARKTLPEFWRQFDKPGEGINGFCLKVRISSGKNSEHFWLRDIRREGKKYSGIIDNDPAIVKTVKIGDRYTFTDEQISDWSFMRNGKIVGNQTARVLVKRLPPDQAEIYKNMLEPEADAK